MSFNIPFTSTPLSQRAASVNATANGNGYGNDARRPPANKIITLGNFSSIMDSWLVPASEGPEQYQDAGKATDRAGNSASAPPSSLRKPASPRKPVASPSSPTLEDSRYNSGFMRGFLYPSNGSQSGSASSTPMLPDSVSEADTDSDDDSSDVVPLGLVMGGLRLVDDGESGQHLKNNETHWSGVEIQIASASTSPATANTAPRAAVRVVTESPSFANRFMPPSTSTAIPSSRSATSNTALASRQAYPGQPSPVAIPPSPRRTKQPSMPHHRKSIPEKLHLARSLLHQEYKLDQKIRSTRPELADRPVHVIVDLSNIIIGFYENAKVRHKLQGRYYYMPFSFKILAEILLRGRPHDKLAAAGSVKDPNAKRPEHMDEAELLGFKMDVLDRVKNQDESSREQGVDEILHLKMCHSILDFEPATLILATGDANVAEFSDGFLSNVRRALRNGWCVELYSWKSNISRAWKDLQREQSSPDTFRIIELDKYLDFMVGENHMF